METINNYPDNNKNDSIKKIKNNEVIEKINAEVNPGFNSEKVIVIRKSDYLDVRTFAIKADKAAFEISRGLIKNISSNKQKITVLLN